MKEQSVNKAKLGAFVLIATTCLIVGLYFIGSKKNIFHSTITVSADFNNVGGLMPGNNVRFNGIDVGTVSKLYPVSDSVIRVEFTVDESSRKFISENSIVSIGTDGLLGSKLLNITYGKEGAQSIQAGSKLKTLDPIQMDNALRTLVKTNDNLEVISDNLKSVSQKFNTNNSLWHLLTDTILAENVRNAVVHFKLTGDNTAIITGDLSKILKDIRSGKGTMGALLTDTTFSKKLKQTIVNIKAISDTTALISGNFENVSEKMKSGKGAFGTILTDTTFVHNLNQSMESIKNGAGNFNEDMEALKHSWPFKKYFKKQNKLKTKKQTL